MKYGGGGKSQFLRCSYVDIFISSRVKIFLFNFRLNFVAGAQDVSLDLNELGTVRVYHISGAELEQRKVIRTVEDDEDSDSKDGSYADSDDGFTKNETSENEDANEEYCASDDGSLSRSFHKDVSKGKAVKSQLG